eukprot:TRINITY_DN8196_c0_g1_i2.p1 TRINITY_DN8196_c0_g1~~TRINITY_DN8196_c0_g1_i2.p1  ORF type:complete len:425 (+),score=89.10 TRINITY_DN8196_c0_g1_i2:67-1341(+)
MALRIRAAVASAPCLARQRRAGWGVPGMQNLKNFFGKSETDKMRDFVAKRDGQTAPRPKGFGAPKRRDEEAVAREASGPQRTLNAALQRLEEVVGQLEGDEHIAAGTVAANLEMYLRYVEAYAEGREVGHEDEEALPAPSATAAVTPRVAAALKHSSDLLTGVREFVDSPSDAELVRSMTKFAVLAGDEKAYETALRCALVGLKVAETATPFPDDGTVEEGDASPLSVMPSVCRYENCLGRQGSVIERCEALLPIATKSPSADGTPDLYLQYAHALYTVGRYADAVAAARSLESLNVPFKQRNAAESLKQAALEGQRAGRHPLLHLPDGAPVYVSVSALFRKVAFLQKFHSYAPAPVPLLRNAASLHASRLPRTGTVRLRKPCSSSRSCTPSTPRPARPARCASSSTRGSPETGLTHRHSFPPL